MIIEKTQKKYWVNGLQRRNKYYFFTFNIFNLGIMIMNCHHHHIYLYKLYEESN